LLNAKVGENGPDYPNGANLFISFYDDTYLKQGITSIMSNAEMCFGMKVLDVTIEENPDLTNKTLFQAVSVRKPDFCLSFGRLKRYSLHF
jgi:hypothetical protein